MIIKNAKIVLKENVIEKGYIEFSKGKITKIQSGEYKGKEKTLDAKGRILMPGFIDVHMHGSAGIDFICYSLFAIPRD